MPPELRTVATARGPVEVGTLGTGPPVLVVHGMPGGADQALAMGGFLADAGFAVIAPSRPGYLGTPLSSGASIDEQADLLDALLDALGHDRAGLLTWSGGGPSGYRLAIRHPARVSAIVAAAALSGQFTPGKETLDERLMLTTSAGNWLLRFLAVHMPKTTVKSTLQAEGDLTKDQLRAVTAEALADEDQTELVLAMANAAADHAHRHEGIANDRAAFAEIASLELERIATPTLIVHGSADADVPPEHSERAAATIPGADSVTLDGGTHLALWVHPEAAAVQERAVALLMHSG
ncbi:MAG: alpha/beta fold hydrolase [Baekduiaceae bacterium]